MKPIQQAKMESKDPFGDSGMAVLSRCAETEKGGPQLTDKAARLCSLNPKITVTKMKIDKKMVCPVRFTRYAQRCD